MPPENPGAMRFRNPILADVDDGVSFGAAATSLMTALIVALVLTPTAFYARNVNELAFLPLDFLPFLAALCGIATVLGFAFLAVFGRARSVVFWIATFAAWMMWVQANVLNFDEGNIEDRMQRAETYLGLIDVIAAACLIALAWKLGRARLAKLNQFFLLFVVLSLVWEVVQAQRASVDVRREFEYVVDSQSKFDFSRDANIILILLDETQSSTFEDLILRDPEFAPQFEDFTLFRNAISNTHSTDHSVPMILTGEFYDNSIPYHEVVQRYRTSSMPLDLRRLGYRTDLYFHTPATTYYHPSFASNSRGNEPNPIQASAQLLDASIYMVSNNLVKSHVYNRGDWWLSAKVRELDWLSGLFGSGGDDRSRVRPVAPLEDDYGDVDTLFIRDLQTNGRVEAKRPTFKFYHLAGSHVPFDMNDKGLHIPTSFDNYEMMLKYKARLLQQLFVELKKLGVYSDATIVVLSDHGSGRSERHRVFESPVDGSRAKHSKELARANAVMLVKHGRELAPSVHDKPYQLKQVPALIKYLATGNSLTSYIDGLPDTAVRRYFSYHWKDVYPYIQRRYQEYIVVKPIWEQDAFVSYHRHPPEYSRGECVFDRTNIEERGRYLGSWPAQRVLPGQMTVLLPSLVHGNDGETRSVFVLIGALARSSFANGPVSLEIVQNGRRIQRVEDLQYKEVFEFDLVSTTVDFDAPIALESESEFEVESLHLFVADSIQADIR